MKEASRLLRRSLVLNALFSALSGALLALFPSAVAAGLGMAEAGPLRGVGLVLLAFAGHLTWASRRRVGVLEGLYFVGSDALWVLGTGVLLALFPDTFSSRGWIVALGVGSIVGVLAALQYVGLRRASRTSG